MSIGTKCPFFRYEDKTKKTTVIHCEKITLGFANKKAKVKYQEAYCNDINGWQKCSVAEFVSKEYEKSDAVG